jgi:CheY-like chemotaxis protein
MTIASQQYQLLLADDDVVFRETLYLILEPHFVLIEASSGAEAVELSERYRIDIALLDMHMPQLTGLEALRVLKAVYAVAPCILITADATDELRRNAAEANAFTVLPKPVTRRELVTTVSSAMEECYDDADIAASLLN